MNKPNITGGEWKFIIEKGVRGEILGNAKELGGNTQSKPQGNNSATLDEWFDDMEDDLPFAWLLLPFGYTLMQIIGL